MDVIKAIFSFIKDWADVFLIGVGWLVLIVYWLQKRDQVCNAATELKEQITEIEDSIKVLKELLSGFNSPEMYQLGPILTENLWQKNRSILSSHLCEEDRKLIQSFYISAEKIERARHDIVKCLVGTWYHKSYLQQKHIYEFSPDLRPGLDKLNMFWNNSEIFRPAVCEKILDGANNFDFLSGSTSYEKLVKLSKKFSLRKR